MTSERGQLALMLRDCPKCMQDTRDNIAVILADEGKLKDEQVTSMLTHVTKLHLTH